MLKTLTLSLLFVSSIGFAKGPCAEDREKLCAGIEKGEGRITKCMKDNEASLGPACTDYIAKMKDARKDVKEACQDDVEALCGDVEAGAGRIMKCMKENKEKLSAACQSEIKEKKEMRKKAKAKS